MMIIDNYKNINYNNKYSCVKYNINITIVVIINIINSKNNCGNNKNYNIKQYSYFDHSTYINITMWYMVLS